MMNYCPPINKMKEECPLFFSKFLLLLVCFVLVKKDVKKAGKAALFNCLNSRNKKTVCPGALNALVTQVVVDNKPTTLKAHIVSSSRHS